MNIRLLTLTGLAVLAAVSAGAQTAVNNTEKQMVCSSNEGRSGERQRRACEIRESRMPAGGRLAVDGRQNGGVTVKGWSGSDVLVRAKVEVWAPESGGNAAGLLGQVRVQSSGGSVRADAPDFGRDSGYAVSYEIFVPHRTALDLKAHNGGISIRDVAGEIRFDAVNGGVNLIRLAGDVKGSTRNGGVKVELDGARWDGTQLDVRTTNGGVTLTIPERYSARLETSTVNGGMNVDYPVTVTGRLRLDKELSVNLGSGGPLVRVATTNGGVSIRKKS